jgi:hypothetical protein
MKWMRRTINNKTTGSYHLALNNNVGQDTHYFYTLCKNEIKGCYNQWDIVEDPPESECCPKCMESIKEHNKNKQ